MIYTNNPLIKYQAGLAIPRITVLSRIINCRMQVVTEAISVKRWSIHIFLNWRLNRRFFYECMLDKVKVSRTLDVFK